MSSSRRRQKTSPGTGGRTRRSSSGANGKPSVPSYAEIDARLALDDHTGALSLARERLRAMPKDRRAAASVRRCEETLTEMYLSRIGDLGQQVHVLKSGGQLQWLNLDHRAGFMVSRVEGSTTVEELLEICGMPRLDALRILHDLVKQKVVKLKRGR